MLRFYARFEINDLTGEQLTEGDMTDLHYSSVTSLQKAAFKYFKEEMKEFYLLNVAAIDTRRALTKQFQSLRLTQLFVSFDLKYFILFSFSAKKVCTMSLNSCIWYQS